MIRGFYTAASGALTQQKTMNVISNNIANVSTVGYKSQSTITSSFYDHVVSRVSSLNKGERSQEIGPGTFMAVTIGEYTNYGQSAFESTNIPTNAAINGNGYFLIDSEQYGKVLTRNGQFSLDDEGYLVLAGMGQVLSEDEEPIQLETSNIKIAGNGEIFDSEGESLNKLYIGTVEEGQELKKIGEDFFHNEDGYILSEETEYAVVQGNVEKSNVGLSEELTKLIASQRNFQSCTQIVKIYDKINEESIVLGKLT